MTEIALEELPQYSPWPARLLGLMPFEVRERTTEKNLKEYDIDKFGNWLRYYHEHPMSTFEDIKLHDRGISPDKETVFSRGGKVYKASSPKAFELEKQLFVESFKDLMSNCDVVIELASGYGYMLSLLAGYYPNHHYIGAELSPNGITLGTSLITSENISLVPFNFLDDTWHLFENLEGKRVLIFSYHGIEMIPDASVVFKKLKDYGAMISDLMFFEPLFEIESDENLLGLLRKKYILMNNYNTNFLSALRDSGIPIVDLIPDFYGANPLFTQTRIHCKLHD